jgi:hypothetical protein
VAGRSHWPSAESFHDAGRFRLYEQVILQGGEAFWAEQFGLRRHDHHPNRSSWTDERIRGALRVYLADKRQWPTGAEFNADGLGALRAAITRQGGADRWIVDSGLPRPHRNCGRCSYWTEQRIREQLTRFCKGRAIFPARRELRKAGLAGMVRAIQADRGLDWWAVELGLPRRRRGHASGPAKLPQLSPPI